MLKFIEDVNASQGKSITLPAGNYMGLYLESENLETAEGGDTAVNFAIMLNGEVIHDTDLSIFQTIDNVFFGMPRWTYDAPNGTQCLHIAVYVPFFVPGSPNALDIDKDDIFTFVYRNADITAGCMSLYGDMSKTIPENYILYLTKLMETGSGRARIRVPDDNTHTLFIEPRDEGDMITIYKDQETVANAYGIELRKLTELLNRIETGTLTRSAVNLAPSGVMAEVLSDDVEVVVNHGASGTSTIWVYTLGFKAERVQRSVTRQITKQNYVTSKAIQRRPNMKSVLSRGVRPMLSAR